MSNPVLPYGSHRRHIEPVVGAPALDIQGLSAVYPGSQKQALQDISLRVPVGARVALVGHNGAGKSTLLKAVAGLLPVQSGTIRIYGNPVGACHHRVAYLPQRGDIDWRFPISLRRLVMTGRYVHLGWLKRPTPHDWQVVDAMIDQLGLRSLANRQIGELSGGQQQRTLIARALAQESDLLLLDEPLNAVDVETRAQIVEVLAGLRDEHKTIIAATHDLGRLADDFDSAVYLEHGRMISPAYATISDLNIHRPLSIPAS